MRGHSTTLPRVATPGTRPDAGVGTVAAAAPPAGGARTRARRGRVTTPASSPGRRAIGPRPARLRSTPADIGPSVASRDGTPVAVAGLRRSGERRREVMWGTYHTRDRASSPLPGPGGGWKAEHRQG